MQNYYREPSQPIERHGYNSTRLPEADFQIEILEQSHKRDGYFQIFLPTMHFTNSVFTFLSTLYHIREGIMNSVVKLTK